jgi:hypothetical protein
MKKIPNSDVAQRCVKLRKAMGYDYHGGQIAFAKFLGVLPETRPSPKQKPRPGGAGLGGSCVLPQPGLPNSPKRKQAHHPKAEPRSWLHSAQGRRPHEKDLSFDLCCRATPPLLPPPPLLVPMRPTSAFPGGGGNPQVAAMW